MTSFKPFLSVIVFSMVFAFILIFLGVRYHWGDYFRPKNDNSLIEPFPEFDVGFSEIEKHTFVVSETEFVPEILEDKNRQTLLVSMNKEQIEEQCINLLSRDIKDPVMLELASINCVISNYQEDFESLDEHQGDKNLEMVITQQCVNQYRAFSQYSETERQLLVGICVSDGLSTN